MPLKKTTNQQLIEMIIGFKELFSSNLFENRYGFR